MTEPGNVVDRFWDKPHAHEASQVDIFYCFRLLLGRSPSAEEWSGHSMMAGEPLHAVVASYLKSLEFSLRGLAAPTPSSDVVLAELPDFRIYCDVSDPAVGKHVHAGHYEPEVAAIFRRLLKPGMGVIDIGANIGFFSMLSATLVGPAGFVLAVEPNPHNAKLLECSRRVNGFEHVRLAQVAAGPDTGVLALHTSHSTGTTSEVQDGLAAMLAADTVPCIQLDRLVPAGRRIDFIKIDVDGAEYKALLGCRETIMRDRPHIVSEFAPDMLRGISGLDGVGYLTWLGSFDYEVTVLNLDGSTERMGQDWSAVMQAYHARGTDHIDILVSPLPSS